MSTFAEETFTVDVLARKHKQYIPAKEGCKWLQDRYSWQHAAAAARHGWNDHRYHAGEPMRLTEQDYLSAIAAVSQELGSFTVHPGAVSEHCPHNDKAAEAAKGAF